MFSTALLAALFAGVSARIQGYTFEMYLIEFGKAYSGTEYKLREEIFKLRLADVLEHNEHFKTGVHSWSKTINKFSDMTEDEISGYYRGYKKGANAGLSSGSPLTAHHGPVEALPTALNWCTSGACTAIKDQGACGSCWAFASTETLESYWYLATQKLPVLSPQQLVDCTPNPNHCGGTGGCEGATAELAYAYLTNGTKNGGLTQESSYPYTATDGKCKDANVLPVATISGFVQVSSNNYTAVINALQTGPLAVAVDASSWGAYGGGIFSGCSVTRNIDIDHLVQLVGYGTDTSGKDYWTVRNSWGPSWGEKGFIRLARDSTGTDCGKDSTPLDGSGCQGGPSVVTVCGQCGILFDTVFPIVKVQ